MMPDASCSSMALAPSVLPEFDPARQAPRAAPGRARRPRDGGSSPNPDRRHRMLVVRVDDGGARGGVVVVLDVPLGHVDQAMVAESARRISPGKKATVIVQLCSRVAGSVPSVSRPAAGNSRFGRRPRPQFSRLPSRSGRPAAHHYDATALAAFVLASRVVWRARVRPENHRVARVDRRPGHAARMGQRNHRIRAAQGLQSGDSSAAPFAPRD